MDLNFTSFHYIHILVACSHDIYSSYKELNHYKSVETMGIYFCVDVFREHLWKELRKKLYYLQLMHFHLLQREKVRILERFFGFM